MATGSAHLAPVLNAWQPLAPELHAWCTLSTAPKYFSQTGAAHRAPRLPLCLPSRCRHPLLQVDRFIELADAIEAAFPSVIVEGNEEVEGRPGAFEVAAEDGRVYFSRLTGPEGNPVQPGPHTPWPLAEQVLEAIARGGLPRSGTGDAAAAEGTGPQCG
jgi:hypothetical protein